VQPFQPLPMIGQVSGDAHQIALARIGTSILSLRIYPIHSALFTDCVIS
jgi:hypothetical protein